VGADAVGSGAVGGVGGGGEIVIWLIIEEVTKKADVIGALILSVLTYFAGVSRGKKYRKEDMAAAAAREAAVASREADRRIDDVVQRYAGLARENKTGGLHGLMIAGIKNLRSHEEVHLARERATAQSGHDPLRQYALDGVNLKDFVEAATFDSVAITNERLLRERFRC
jgi:hypothetical protein